MIFLICKSLEFKNEDGQKIKVIEIPVLASNSPHYFMVQARLERFISLLYHNPQEKSCYSFRDHLKRKMSWADFMELYSIQDFKNNA